MENLEEKVNRLDAIQETKAQEYQLLDDCFRPEGYFCYYNDALKKGCYS